MTTQHEKAEKFQRLHANPGTFIIPNPWDKGSARLMEAMGFVALATTSAGYAQSLGRIDGEITLEEKLQHCRELAGVTEIPISADFENGFADDPASAAGNLLRLAETGIVGASIEDYSPAGIYDQALAVERINACAEAVHALPFPFTLTARAENLLRGVNDLDNTIARLKDFERAGADVLYAPGLRSIEDIKRVLAEINKPLNVLTAFLPQVRASELEALGVKRLSVGGAIANMAIGAILRCGQMMQESGSFEWMLDAPPGAEIKKLLRAPANRSDTA